MSEVKDADQDVETHTSGGPVFASQTAFGLMKGASFSGNAKGQCNWFIYMSTDFSSNRMDVALWKLRT